MMSDSSHPNPVPDGTHERYVRRLYLVDGKPPEFKSEQCCSCKFYVPLSGTLGADWGVCSNPRSPRDCLLTFEHDGCQFHESRR